MDEIAVRALFQRYQSLFNRALHGDNVDMTEVASLYAQEFIGASPAGIATGKNDDTFRQVMTQGYAYYRQIGTRETRIRDVRVVPIDEHHCLAHVAWTAVYTRTDLLETAIDFDVHYLVQVLNGHPKVFGWVSGDEQDVLRRHGVI